jgi:VWA domain containing CoxE-like protein
VQLGGGTDINRAVAYGQSLVRLPTNTTFVLISDLYKGGVEAELLQRANPLVTAGVNVIVLLALRAGLRSSARGEAGGGGRAVLCLHPGFVPGSDGSGDRKSQCSGLGK